MRCLYIMGLTYESHSMTIWTKLLHEQVSNIHQQKLAENQPPARESQVNKVTSHSSKKNFVKIQISNRWLVISKVNIEN